MNGDENSIYADTRWCWIAHDMDASLGSTQAANLSSVLAYKPEINEEVCVESRYLMSVLFLKLWENED